MLAIGVIILLGHLGQIYIIILWHHLKEEVLLNEI